VRLLVFLAMLVPAGAGAAPMFKCVDARGITHYSEKPVPGCKGREVDIQPLPPPSGREQPPARDLAEQEREFKRRQVERAQGEEKEAAERKRAEQRCQSLRSELGRLTTGRRVSQVDAKGERTFMDDAVREKRVAEVQGEIGRSCR